MTSKQKTLIAFYKELSDLTRPLCSLCRVPFNCCSAEYCSLAKSWAKDRWNLDISSLAIKNNKIPFLSKEGCLVAPHLRPICTLHHCQINSLGFFIGQKKLTNEYFSIREKIEELESEL